MTMFQTLYCQVKRRFVMLITAAKDYFAGFLIIGLLAMKLFMKVNPVSYESSNLFTGKTMFENFFHHIDHLFNLNEKWPKIFRK